MKANTTLAPDNSTDANFRLWVAWISTQMAAAGWVQTADTGQINTATVAKPTAANNYPGFEIWRTNDGLTNFYLRLDYGAGSNQLYPSLKVQWGVGTNGTGTLSSPGTQQTVSVTANSTSPMTCYMSGATDRIFFGMWSNGGSTSTYLGFYAERVKDGTGANTSERFSTWSYGYTNSYFQTIVTAAYGGPHSVVSRCPAMNMQEYSGVTTASDGLTTSIFEVYPMRSGVRFDPLANIFAYYKADLIAYSILTFQVYGSNHDYIAMDLGTGANPSTSAHTNFGMLVRYE